MLSKEKIIKKWLKESLNCNEMQIEYYIKLLEMNRNNKSGKYKILYLRRGGCCVLRETTDLDKKEVYLDAYYSNPINKYNSVLYSKYIISGEENIKKVKEFFKNDK